MAKLHQILAIDRGVGADTQRAVELATRGTGVTGDQSPLNGLSRTYQPRAEDGGEMARPVPARPDPGRAGRPAHDRQGDARLFDVKLTREEANARAHADEKVFGYVRLAHYPSPTQAPGTTSSPGRGTW